MVGKIWTKEKIEIKVFENKRQLDEDSKAFHDFFTISSDIVVILFNGGEFPRILQKSKNQLNTSLAKKLARSKHFDYKNFHI